MNPISRFLAEIEIKAEKRKGSAIAMLQADHRKVQEMLAEFQSLPSGRVAKQKLLNELIKELTVHSRVESELVYPIIDKELHEKTQESLEQHHLVDLLLKELGTLPADREEAGYKVTVLSELVDNHIKEEESLLLPQLKLSRVDMQKLGEKIKTRKEELLAEFKKSARPKAKRASSNRSTAGRSANARKRGGTTRSKRKAS